MRSLGIPQIGVVAATFTGNRGAEAMLTTVVEQVRSRYPQAEIHVLSYSPRADLAWLRAHHVPRVYVHSSTPAALVGAWFPLACLARWLPFLRPARLYPEHDQGILRLLRLDAVVDLAGVSFMDGRQKFLPFNVLSLFPFLLHGVPVFKLSQAVGPIRVLGTRFAARYALPRLALTVARAHETARNLVEFGLPRDRWIEAPDTSFCLRVETTPVSQRRGVVVMPSSLMARTRPGYETLLIDTIRALRTAGIPVDLLAHSWKTNTSTPRNNDLPLCRSIHAALGRPQDMAVLGPDLDARAIKARIGRYRTALTSRFHGMIAALDTETPVIVLGWSHKYREVLDEFGMGDNAVRSDATSAAALAGAVAQSAASAEEIVARIRARLPAVRERSAAQFVRMFSMLESRLGPAQPQTGAPTDFEEPDTSSPIGSYRKVWIGWSADEQIRVGAASGGIVSSVFIHLLATRQVDAALVCHSNFSDGKLDHRIFLARTREEVLSAQTSKYFDIPILQGLKLIEAFEGRVAIVGLPSQINAISRRLVHSPDLARKIVFKIAIFCGHNSKDELVRRVWRKRGIDESAIARFYYRRGLWRGRMRAEMKDGTVHEFPFQEFSHYQNLHILSLERCLNCFDHMGYYADLSTGDVWMKRFEGSPTKPSIFLARTERAEQVVREMLDAGKLTAEESDRATLYRSQMRSINYHYAVAARAQLAPKFRVNLRDRTGDRVRLRDRLAARVVLTSHRISHDPDALNRFMKLPRLLITAYVYLFKGLTHYRRKTY